ncbi:MAG TPA: chemotaxis protein CheW [Polyangia bacterium]|nr:chemotaxis protein CheW [Polyangia bacterium]
MIEPRSDDLVQLAAFRIGDEEFAIDIMRIKQIIHPQKITKVPKAPRFVEGVVELRGAILPIVDLRRRFDVPNRELTRASKYIIVSIDDRLIGLVVDAVSQVLRVPRADIKPPPEFGPTGGPTFFTGVCQVGDRIVMILDLDQVLTRQERIELGTSAPKADPA